MQVGAAAKHSKAALAAFHDAGGFARVTQLLLWAAVAFSPAGGVSTGHERSGAADGARDGGSRGAQAWRADCVGAESGDVDPSSSAALRCDGVASTSAPGKTPALPMSLAPHEWHFKPGDS